MDRIKNPDTRRWLIVLTMFIAIVCNYLDRQLLSILKPEILTHYGIGDLEYAWIVNIFLICYAVMYPLGGMLVDKFGPKKVMLAGITVWSLACIGGGLSPNVWLFTLCRGFLGLSEPVIFAGQIVVVTLWFEKEKRATANSLCTIGGTIGAVVAPLLIAWLMRLFSYWQYIFIISGVIGLLIAFCWIFIYKTPPADLLRRTVGSGNKAGEGVTQKSFTFGGLFKTKTLWGGILIRLISDPVWYFCCFWLPGFLRNMGASEGLSTNQTLDMIQWIGGIPFLFGAIGGILTSAWSDHLVKRGRSSLSARKIVLISIVIIAPLCMLIPSIGKSVSIPFAWRIGLVIAIFSLVAVLCLSWLYTLPVIFAESFPIGNVATVMGLCCGAGALGSVVFNQFAGSIPENAWTALFIVMGTLHIFSAFILWKMVGIEKPETVN
ncbi:MAG: MFS transporter [Bacteroidales bacterium]|jgi:ACS family hexuronate transporter-like MFS transporter|nr:MFS transporter [Bacteroidales bacterium]